MNQSKVRAIGLILAFSVANGVAAPLADPAATRGSQATNRIVDLMLIYDGGEKRPVWTAEAFAPYVYCENVGHVEWLFDGFLFIEYLSKSGNRLCPITHRKDAVKRDWEDLMDHYFQEGQSIAALDQLLESLAKKGQVPARKRQVVITLPTPMTGSDPTRIVITSDWGELEGRKLDFHQTADRLKAAQWYVDQTIARWGQKHYRHLELAGFYWVFERAWKVHHSREIGDYIRSRGLRLYWIPSWPQGRANWPEYGFDFVYQQPNYFFHRKPTPVSRLEEACQFARGCGTSMEMEFNKDLLTKPAFLEYFDQYLQAYQRHRVWDLKPVAYYEGVGAWSEMSVSTNAAVRDRYRALCQVVTSRQKKADQAFIFKQGATEP